MKVGVYCRVSKDKGGADRSIPTQIDYGERFASEKGWDIELYIEDEGTSGTLEADDRPEFFRLISDIKRGEIQVAFALDISRFERNDTDRLLLIKTLDDAKGQLWTAQNGRMDFNDPQIALLLRMLSAINTFHVDMTKDKVNRTLTKNVADGRNHGIPTFGYRSGDNKVLEIHPENAKIVKRIFEMCVTGNGGTTISKILSDEGIPTPAYHSGGEKLKYRTKNLAKKVEVDKSKLKWNPVAINRILKNPQYKGERFWSGKIYPVDAIVSADLWNKAQESIARNKNNGINNTYNDYLLKEKIVCGNCGYNYHGYAHTERNVHVYMCGLRKSVIKGDRKCNNKRINQAVIEDIIWQRVIGNPLLLNVLKKEFEFDTLEPVESHHSAIDQFNKQLEGLIKARKKLITMNSREQITDDELEQHLLELQVERDEVEAKLNSLKAKQEIFNNRSEILNEIAEFQAKFTRIEEAPFIIKRRLVDIFIDKVVVNYNHIDKLTELTIQLKLNLDYHSLTEEISIDLIRYKKELSYNIDGSGCAPGV